MLDNYWLMIEALFDLCQMARPGATNGGGSWSNGTSGGGFRLSSRPKRKTSSFPPLAVSSGEFNAI